MSATLHTPRKKGPHWTSREVASLLQFYHAALQLRKKGAKHETQKDFGDALAKAMVTDFPDFEKDSGQVMTKLRNVSKSLQDVRCP